MRKHTKKKRVDWVLLLIIMVLGILLFWKMSQVDNLRQENTQLKEQNVTYVFLENCRNVSVSFDSNFVNITPTLMMQNKNYIIGIKHIKEGYVKICEVLP